MPGIYDRLQEALEVRKREAGISPIEIAELPPNLRKVMRLLLREGVLKYNDLCRAIEAQPPEDRLSPPELEAALEVLVEQNWVSRYGSREYTSYRVNLRRRTGDKLEKDIWSALDDQVNLRRRTGKKLDRAVWNTLDERINRPQLDRPETPDKM